MLLAMLLRLEDGHLRKRCVWDTHAVVRLPLTDKSSQILLLLAELVLELLDLLGSEVAIEGGGHAGNNILARDEGSVQVLREVFNCKTLYIRIRTIRASFHLWDTSPATICRMGSIRCELVEAQGSTGCRHESADPAEPGQGTSAGWFRLTSIDARASVAEHGHQRCQL